MCVPALIPLRHFTRSLKATGVVPKGLEGRLKVRQQQRESQQHKNKLQSQLGKVRAGVVMAVLGLVAGLFFDRLANFCLWTGPAPNSWPCNHLTQIARIMEDKGQAHASAFQSSRAARHEPVADSSDQSAALPAKKRRI